MSNKVSSKVKRLAALWMVVTAVVPAPLLAQEEPSQTAAVAEAPKVYRDKTLIEVDGRAEQDGVIMLVVQPNNGAAKEVRLNVLAKTKPKKITQDLVRELEFALGDGYKVKQTGDTKLRVETKSKKTPPVAITIDNQSLAGVAIKIKQG